MSVVLDCDNCGKVDTLLPVTLEWGYPDPDVEESWCPECVADALLEPMLDN